MRSRNKLGSVLVAIFLAVVASGGFTERAEAIPVSDLVSKDWMAAGDGLLTLDTNTGLEWLDLSVTATWSIMDVYNAAYLDDSSDLYGFRWANFSEIEDFLDLPIAACCGGSPDAYDHALEMIDLLGLSHDLSGQGDFIAAGFRDTPGAAFCAAGDSSVCTNADNHPVIFWAVEGRGGFEVLTDAYSMIEEPPEYVGHFLVRTAQVPEPGTLILMGAGLIGVMALRRRFRR